MRKQFFLLMFLFMGLMGMQGYAQETATNKNDSVFVAKNVNAGKWQSSLEQKTSFLYEAFIAPLVKLLQQLNSEIDLLKDENAALRYEIRLLRQGITNTSYVP